MTRNALLSAAAVLTLGLACMEPCQAGAHGGRRRRADGPGAPSVDWAESIAEATDAAQKEDKPFLIYFCSEEVAKFAGMGERAVNEYRKTAKPPLPPNTPFENPDCTDLIRALDCPMVKIPATAQNAEVLRKYKALAVPALIACAPTGFGLQSLVGPDQANQTGVLGMLKGLKELYAAWKKAHPAKDAAKAEAKAQPAVP